ncbi:unnamed protein product [Closterium sp. Naga37s-1]|nr:unnamed protein product [Closterium sp. Naga37s-1]
MPRVTKKTVKPVNKPAGTEVMDPAAKGHQSEPATPKPQLKDVEGPFDGGVRASLAKRLSALKFPSSDAPVVDGDNNTNEGQGKEEEVKSPIAAPDAPEEGSEDEEEEDDGYLIDDPEERFDPVKAGEIAARAGFRSSTRRRSPALLTRSRDSSRCGGSLYGAGEAGSDAFPQWSCFPQGGRSGYRCRH